MLSIFQVSVTRTRNYSAVSGNRRRRERTESCVLGAVPPLRTSPLPREPATPPRALRSPTDTPLMIRRFVLHLQRLTFFIAAFGAATVASACAGGESSTEVEQRVPRVVVVAGVDSQTAVVATSLPQMIGVKVTDQNAVPMAGYGVGWSVTTGAGTLSASVSSTDSTGVAKTSWVLGQVAGAQTVTATLANGSSIVVTAIAQPLGLSALALVSDPFIAVAAGSATTPLQVRALDRYGNNVGGQAHTWITSGGTLSGGTTVTAANGVASAILTTEPTPRDYTVTARFAGGYEATFVVRGN